MATNCVSVHRIYIALEPSLDGKEPTAFKAVVLSSLSEAEEENGQSRIYLGIHCAFDKSEGIFQGQRVADYVFAHTFAPLQTSNHRLQRNSLR